jgi:hypothetical protein
LIASKLKVNTEVNKLFQSVTSFIVNDLKVNINVNWRIENEDEDENEEENRGGRRRGDLN